MKAASAFATPLPAAVHHRAGPSHAVPSRAVRLLSLRVSPAGGAGVTVEQ